MPLINPDGGWDPDGGLEDDTFGASWDDEALDELLMAPSS